MENLSAILVGGRFGVPSSWNSSSTASKAMAGMAHLLR
jgi:hypothetical protein